MEPLGIAGEASTCGYMFSYDRSYALSTLGLTHFRLQAAPLAQGTPRACHIFGQSEGVVRCPKTTPGTLRTGSIVSEGVCTVAAGPSVQSPFGTGSAVYKAARPEKASVQSRALRTGRCALTVLRSATRPRATASHGGVPNRHLTGATHTLCRRAPFVKCLSPEGFRMICPGVTGHASVMRQVCSLVLAS